MLRFLTSQERNVIWLLLAIAFLPVDGTTLGLYAPFWSPISPALFAVYCLCNWRQLRIVANRYLPMFFLPVACIILSIPGWLKFGIRLNAAFMSITGLLGVLADSRLSSIVENGAEGDRSFFARIYQSLDPICGAARPSMDHVHWLWCGQYRQRRVGWRIQGRTATKWS